MAQLRAFPSAVAIPVRDEEDQIGGCLAALLKQSEPPDHVVLLINNTTDRSAEVARETAAGSRTSVHIIERKLQGADANAGTARRLAMDLAAELVGKRGALLTTDADGRVPPNWVAANLAWLRGGHDAVCGMAAIDPADEAAIPAHLVADDAAETRYTELLDEIDSLIDPRPYDPWPRHTHRSGASIAIGAAVYRAVGGVPPVPHGEDRALIAALERRDGKIRHDPALEVVVSGRVVGRAEGGMAATIARRMLVQDRWADDRLEAPEAAMRRARLRVEARQTWAGNNGGDSLAAALGIAPEDLAAMMRGPWFGAAWAAIEAASPALRRQPIAMTELAEGAGRATRLLARLKSSLPRHAPQHAKVAEWMR
ncbi:glycosyltransferase family A protein [Acidisoma sp.]|uniref:glycosyltransferase family A protein n=1 Tax=Acidisoma sp. TaxID=1872115 RepID=UPI003B0014F4